MAVQAFITAAQAGERARLRHAQQGPVTRAIAAMRAADPDRTQLRTLRAAISRQIEADLERVDRCLSILDAITPDPDIEADHILHGAHAHGSGLIGVSSDFEPSLCEASTIGFGEHWPSDNSLAFLDRERDDVDVELTAAEWAGYGVHRFSVGEAA